MIRNKEDLKYYIEQDLLMNDVKKKGRASILKDFFFPDPIIKFLYYLRKVEYYSNVHSNINSLICIYYKIKLRKVERYRLRLCEADMKQDVVLPLHE